MSTRAPSSGVAPRELTLPIPVAPRPSRWRRPRAWLREHRGDLAWLTPLLVLAGLVHSIGMVRAPQFIDDEGTYTAQAYAVDRLGELTHYTYWYDHPPLGWIQIAGWTRMTGAFDRVDHAVVAGREVMLIAAVVSAALLWALARRLALPRTAAGAAVLIFVLSPLAVQFHRTVYLDNIAVVWILAAFVLATARTHQLLAFTTAGFAAATAVLTKETFLLLAPFVAWTMWRAARPPIRRYTLVVAGSVFVLLGTAYLTFSLLKGELVPGGGRVSLWDGVAFQLVERAGSGSLTDPGSVLRRSVGVWWDLDPVLLVAGIVAGILALFSRSLRPVGAALVLLALMVVRPGGYVPVPHVIAMLPLMAVLIPGVAHRVIRRFRRAPGMRTGAPLGVVVAAATAAVLVAAPSWVSELRGLLRADLNAPITKAQQWVETYVPRDSRLIVDDAMWVDLVEAGFDREDVVWYYKVDTDPEVMARSPNGWRDSDYIITTDSMRTFPGAFPQVAEALDNSTTVASFGADDQRVEIRQIHPDGTDSARAAEEASRRASRAAGRELLANDALTFTDDAVAAVSNGQLDTRLALVLGQIARDHAASVTLPEIPGEDDRVRRRVVLDDVEARDGAGTSTRELETWLRSQPEPFTPSAVEVDSGRLAVTYPVTEPSGLLPGGELR